MSNSLNAMKESVTRKLQVTTKAFDAFKMLERPSTFDVSSLQNRLVKLTNQFEMFENSVIASANELVESELKIMQNDMYKLHDDIDDLTDHVQTATRCHSYFPTQNNLLYDTIIIEGIYYIEDHIFLLYVQCGKPNHDNFKGATRSHIDYRETP